MQRNKLSFTGAVFHIDNQRTFMKMKQLHCSAILLIIMGLIPVAATAQEETIVVDSLSKSYKKVIAGDYERSRFYKFLFGEHYRKVWVTPVKTKVLMLDTVYGGLTPYEAGGGRQSKSLKLRDNNKREYVLRSLDKSFGRALPEIMQGTFIEDLIDDQVTIAHPYSAFTIPPMAEAARIYHTNPIMRYVPEQKRLDSFNKDFGNRLYMLEQRPDEDWSIAPNFGSSKNIVGTDKVLEKLLKDSDNRIDQALYVRSRLFDMFISDWGRHEDQWRWASQEKGDITLYQPIPRDRDQAYTMFDGLITQITLSAANLKRLQTFKGEVENINTFNYPARHLDRRMTNELPKEQWIAIAKDLQRSLTDEIIRSSIKKMPPEVFPISGQEIIDKLIVRRNQLDSLANIYYSFLARHVDVVGSDENEHFEVKRINDEETLVEVFKLNDGKKEKTPFYSRLFKTSETKDVRLYGIEGNDIFNIDGHVSKSIKVRVIGGPHRDSIIDQSEVDNKVKATVVYDNKDNYLDLSSEARTHLSGDTTINRYDYEDFGYHKKGISFSIFYDNPDRLYLGAGYSFKRHMWRKDPWGFEQAVYVRYSVTQNALSLLYDGRFAQVIGKWDLRVIANQDFIRWTNFYGLGNETENIGDRIYYQLRTNEFLGSLTLSRKIRKHHTVELTGSFSAIKVVEDPLRLIADLFTPEQLNFYGRRHFLSARAGYNFQKVDNVIIPEKGMMFYIGGAYTQNLMNSNKSFWTGNSILQLFIPLPANFSLSLRGGVESISGEPEFYQYASVGGSQTIRGYRRDRFWGKTGFYNTNELRWITDFKTYLVNGKAGIVAFIDEGRVWMPGETSDQWHIGYGAGILLAPFNMATASLNYGISKEGGRFHIRINRLLKQ